MKKGSNSFVKIIDLIEQSFHYNEFIKGSLTTTNDYVFLANDLRKYGWRTKFNIIYDPEIEEKIEKIKEEELKGH